jgi:hypothetical protein
LAIAETSATAGPRNARNLSAGGTTIAMTNRNAALRDEPNASEVSRHYTM